MSDDTRLKWAIVSVAGAILAFGGFANNSSIILYFGGFIFGLGLAFAILPKR